MNLKEFAKLALDLQSARAATGALSKYIIRPPKRLMKWRFTAGSMGPVKTPRGEVLRIVGQRSYPKRAADRRFSKELEAKRQAPPVLNPSERELNNRMTLLHESSELKHTAKLKSTRRFKKGFFSHTDPGVLAEEHNAVTSLPKQYENLKKHHVRTREVSGEHKDLQGTGMFNYGKSPKVSKAHKRNLLSPSGFDSVRAARIGEIRRRVIDKFDELKPAAYRHRYDRPFSGIHVPTHHGQELPREGYKDYERLEKRLDSLKGKWKSLHSKSKGKVNVEDVFPSGSSALHQRLWKKTQKTLAKHRVMKEFIRKPKEWQMRDKPGGLIEKLKAKKKL